MDDAHCLHPDASEIEKEPLRLRRVAAAAGAADLWRCEICAGWFVRVVATRMLAEVTTPEGQKAFTRYFSAWIRVEAARRSVTPEAVWKEVLGNPFAAEQGPKAPSRATDASRSLAREIGRRLVALGVLAREPDDDEIQPLGEATGEAGPWSLGSLLSALPDDVLARRRVIAPARALGTADPWEVAELANEDTVGDESIGFVLLPAGDAGDLLAAPKSALPGLATWDALRGEDRRRLARLGAKTKAPSPVERK